MKITHYDLFAGIGGFSLALDTIFNEYERKHIFCEWEAFPTAILKKHWQEGTYYGDIADLIADTDSQRWERERREDERRLRQSSGEVQDEEQMVANATDTERQRPLLRQAHQAEGYTELGNRDGCDQTQDITILTGGFPCQPFSHAGRRQGTSDDRYKWQEMFAVIRNVRPDWVIAENVRGLVTWNEGMVLETVCADLESEGYEVQPLIIPAVAVGAPHRRDRVWIVANRTGSQNDTEYERPSRLSKQQGSTMEVRREAARPQDRQTRDDGNSRRTWNTDWREVAFTTCHDGVDDGLPRRMDGTTISASRHRKERLKACGNAIVPQVAMQIFEAIKYANKKI